VPLNIDLTERREIERKLDELNNHPDPDVGAKAKSARVALRARSWAEVRRLLAEIDELQPAPIRLMDLMVTEGGIASRAHARRLIAHNTVFVDGRRAKSGELDVTGCVVVISGREIQSGDEP